MSAAGPLKARLAGRLGGFALDVALEVPAQGVTALVGPSASGKSTLLRALAGLERLGGDVRVGVAVWQDAARFTPPHRRAVGFVFQRAALLGHLSVRRNLDYGRRRAGLAPAETARIAQLMRLEPLLERMPDRLSGGERQRVAVARALLAAPRLLLLDEPLTGLDEDAKAELLPALQRAFADLCIPILYVSHDRAEVARLATRTLHLQAGRIMPAEHVTSAGASLAGRSADEIAALARAALRAGLDPEPQPHPPAM